MIKGDLSNPGGPHLSEEVFRRYEDHFQEFVLTYPGSLTLTPKDLAATTFAAQLRNAANAFISKGFESNLDRNLFAAVWAKSMVTTCDGKVLVGPKDSVKQALRAEVINNGEPQYLCDLVQPTNETLDALAVLYRNLVFQNPSRLVLSRPWAPPPGCVLEPQTDGSFLLL